MYFNSLNERGRHFYSKTNSLVEQVNNIMPLKYTNGWIFFLFIEMLIWNLSVLQLTVRFYGWNIKQQICIIKTTKNKHHPQFIFNSMRKLKTFMRVTKSNCFNNHLFTTVRNNCVKSEKDLSLLGSWKFH